jgi:hypothetical protein
VPTVDQVDVDRREWNVRAPGHRREDRPSRKALRGEGRGDKGTPLAGCRERVLVGSSQRPGLRRDRQLSRNTRPEASCSFGEILGFLWTQLVLVRRNTLPSLAANRDVAGSSPARGADPDSQWLLMRNQAFLLVLGATSSSIIGPPTS